MQIDIQKMPFLRLLIPFIAGILIASQTEFNLDQRLLWSVLVFLLLFQLVRLFLKLPFSLRWIDGFVVSLFMLSLGVLNTFIQEPSTHPSHILHQPAGIVLARITDAPEKRELTTRFTLSVIAVKDSLGNTTKASGMVMTFAANSEKTDSLHYGQIIVVLKSPGLVEGPANPGQYDYQAHLRKKGIYHQLFLKDIDWAFTGESKPNPVFALSYRIRDYLLQTLNDNGLDQDELAVASAILLGYDDKLPQYLRKGYAAAGAMHILCVSGLHVGIVFLIVNFLLGLTGKKRSLRIVRTVVLLASIWVYALITGLSPSVLRATVMLSFVLMARLLNRRGNVINSMAASALILLIAEPMTLYHIGFQLSYLAVLGIVLLHKTIFDLIYVKNKFLRYCWEITAVSIAAQVTTTPLSVYYFDQFPAYFWLSNLFLVPLSFLVIVAGMGVLLLSFVPVVSGLIGSLVSLMLYVLNFIVLQVEALPGSTWQMLHLTLIETLWMYVILLILIAILQLNLKRAMFPVLLAVLALLSSFSYRTYHNMHQKSVVVYSVGIGTAISFVSGKEHVLLADSAVLASQKTHEMNLKGHWTQAGLSGKPVRVACDNVLFDNGFFRRDHDLIGFQGSMFYLWTKDSEVGQHPDGTRIPIKMLFVRGNCPDKLNEIKERFDVEMIVLDETVPPWQRKRWVEQSKLSGINLHDVKQKGALIVAL
jgi:competence protein ComEC